jgi:hypothetical protein
VPLKPRDILCATGLNSVTFIDSYAKLCFTSLMARAFSQDARRQEEQKKILYIDTDTSFTAYLRAGFILRDEINAQLPKNDPFLSAEDGMIPIDNIDGDTKGKNIFDKKKNQNIHRRSSCSSNRLIDVYLPSEGRFESILGQVITSMPEASIVIFDSLNSFYNLYPTSYAYSSQPTKQAATKKNLEKDVGKQNADKFVSGAREAQTNPLETLEVKETKNSAYSISRLNHLLSIFIMLLLKHGVYLNIPVLVTSMVRYKKVSEGLWVKSPACRRLLHQKSVVRLSVEMSAEKDLSVNIMKHPSIAQQTVVFENAGIHSAFEVDQGKPKHHRDSNKCKTRC